MTRIVKFVNYPFIVTDDGVEGTVSIRMNVLENGNLQFNGPESFLHAIEDMSEPEKILAVGVKLEDAMIIVNALASNNYTVRDLVQLQIDELG